MKIGCGSFFIPTSHTIIATILTLIVALEHLYMMYMEMLAGTYGALTASKKIFFAQALPAIVAMVGVLAKV